MQVVLPPKLEELVQRQIASGKYQTVLDVLTAGVQLLEHQEPESEVENAPYGELDENLQFSPLSEEEMTQQSLAVLANYQQEDSFQGQLQNLQKNPDMGELRALLSENVDR
jgi:Arc/MetJ-type ribon-helix-helix transcriptional regulator